MAAQRGLREDQHVVAPDLEAATARRNQNQLLDLVRVALQYRVRQTGGALAVASAAAEFNHNLHPLTS
jgi:hypothetical protein